MREAQGTLGREWVVASKKGKIIRYVGCNKEGKKFFIFEGYRSQVLCFLLNHRGVCRQIRHHGKIKQGRV
jgi:hypothetical protein